MSELVYFLFAKEVQRIKIGLSSIRSFRSRIRDLQTGSPCHLRVIHHMVADARLERELQDELRQYRFTNEWFCYCPAVFLGIRSVLIRDPYFDGSILSARFPAPIIQDDDAHITCVDNAKYGHPSLKSKLLSGETLPL
jgi:Meiotically up-regulated gene 113